MRGNKNKRIKIIKIWKENKNLNDFNFKWNKNSKFHFNKKF